MIAQVNRTIEHLDAASSPAELDAALARAKATLSDTAVSGKLADTNAQHTANKLETLVKQEHTDGAHKSQALSEADSGQSSADLRKGKARDGAEGSIPARTHDIAKLKADLGYEAFARLSERLDVSQIQQLRDGFGPDYLQHLVNGPKLDPKKLLKLLDKPGPAQMKIISKRVEELKGAGVKGDLSKIERDALHDQLGARGELDAMQRWVSEGKDVEALPEVQNAGTNPDYLVSKNITEVKTTDKKPSDDGIKALLQSANTQIKRKSGAGVAQDNVTGHLEIQFVRQDRALVTLEHVEQILLRHYRSDQFRSIEKVSMFLNGDKLGVWQRGADGAIVNVKRGSVSQ